MIIEKRNILKNYFKDVILDHLMEDIENKDEGMEVFLEALHETLTFEMHECDNRSMRCLKAKRLLPPVKETKVSETAAIFRLENKHTANSRWLQIGDPFDACPSDVEPTCDV